MSTARSARTARRPAQSWPFAAGVVLITLLLFTLGWSASRGTFPFRSGQAPAPSGRPPFYLPVFYSLGRYWVISEADHVSRPTPTPRPTLTPTPTATPSPSPTASATLPPSPTATPTPSPTPTPTPTPWPTPDGVIRQVRVPILMYHHIALPPPGADAIERDLSVSPQNFEAQLQWLAQNGYTSIRLYDLVYALAQGRPLPEKPVIFTFDDGYRDAYENAFPLLQKYGFTGTFFVLTEFMDQNLPQYLSWSQAEEMSAAGMDIEPHTKTHPDLRWRDRDFLIWQILGSAQTVEAHTGRFPRFFAYPSGHYDANVLQIVREIGLWGALTTQQGTIHTSDVLYELKRVRIRHSDTLETFAIKLAWDF